MTFLQKKRSIICRLSLPGQALLNHSQWTEATARLHSAYDRAGPCPAPAKAAQTPSSLQVASSTPTPEPGHVIEGTEGVIAEERLALHTASGTSRMISGCSSGPAC